MLDDLVLCEFQGNKYYSVKDYDTVLRIMYGDYMTLPPEEEQTWTHHPILLDFEHDYEELQ